MFKKLFFCTALPFSILAQTPSASITGNLKLKNPVVLIYVSYNSMGTFIKDSVAVKNNSFSYNAKINEGTPVSLIPKRNNPGASMKENPVLIYIYPGNKIQLSIKDDFNNYVSSGTAANEDFQKMVKQRKPYLDSIDAMKAQYDILNNENKKDELRLLEKKLNETDKALKENIYLSYVKSHYDSPLSLYALNKYLGIEFKHAEVEDIYNQLSAEVKNWPAGETFKRMIDLSKQTSIGAHAPDFTMNDTSGKSVSLSSYKGKYILLDFWASWCGPCRGQSPFLVSVYKKYKEKGFDIVSISLDRPGKREDWLAAVHNDELNWMHLSDLNFFDSKAVKIYGIDVTGIPFNFLINPEGVIIAKNLRNENLEEKLSEVFKN